MAQLNIKEVTSHKHLGLIISDDGSWHEHIEHVRAKSWFRLNIMRKLKFQLDRKSLEIIYTSFIRPLLEYSNVIWDNCTQYEENDLEKNPKRSCPYCYGRHKINFATILLLLLLGQKHLVFKINYCTAENIVLFSDSDKLASPYKSTFKVGNCGNCI